MLFIIFWKWNLDGGDDDDGGGGGGGGGGGSNIGWYSDYVINIYPWWLGVSGRYLDMI